MKPHQVGELTVWRRVLEPSSRFAVHRQKAARLGDQAMDEARGTSPERFRGLRDQVEDWREWTIVEERNVRRQRRRPCELDGTRAVLRPRHPKRSDPRGPAK